MDILSILGAWTLCTLASERTAEVLVDSKLFAPLRNLVATIAIWPQTQKHLADSESRFAYSVIVVMCKPCKFLSDLLSCGWCTSAWTSLMFSMFLPGQKLVLGVAYDNIIVKWLALFGLANMFHSSFRLVHRGRVLAVDLNIRIVPPDIPQTETEFNLGAK